MAASDYFNQIQQLYIAYFGRPADPEGQSYWAAEVANSNGNLSSVIASFSISAESNTLLGSLSSSQIVTAIYANIFNRSPEAEGLAYWIGQIESGAISDAQAAWTILQSAGTEDTKAVQNKLAAANAFTSQVDTNAEITGYAGATALAHGRAFLAAIDGTTASMDNLQANAAHAVTIATGTAPAPAPALPVQPPIFSAIDHAGVVSFSGSATGDITVTWSGAVGDSGATFSRGGFSTDPITFGSGAANSITLADNQTLVGSATTLAGLTVNGTGAVSLTDTAAALSTKTFAANTANDVLTVQISALQGSSADLTHLTGFETINLSGDFSLSPPLLKIADGAGTIINSSTQVGVTLGAGGQIFNGSVFSETVIGGLGNDTIAAGAGSNMLMGGDGDDTFSNASGSFNTIVDLKTGDVLVVEGSSLVTADSVSNFVATAQTVNNGTVQIKTFLPSVIDLTLAQGSNGFTVNADTGIGDDKITGSTKDDVIIGGTGKDTLTGGLGNDTFIITGVSVGTNGLDTIRDFMTGSDKIQFNLMAVNAATGGPLVEGSLNAANFVSGSGVTADSASSYFIYDTDTGTLSFDADGDGAGSAVALVTLTGVPPLAASDIALVA